MVASFRVPALLLVGGLIGGTALSTRNLGAAPAKAAPPGRVVVGLKQSWSPALEAQLRTLFKGQFITMAPSGAYVLVLLKPGQRLVDVQAMSPRIAWVEPEVVMGLPEPLPRGPIIIPAPRPEARR